ncbi:MAG: hypothetical protein K8R85_12535, partial [Bacteroidetes bacterium]|nr:hypothetical protein [Bacteroidota bacterium]
MRKSKNKLLLAISLLLFGSAGSCLKAQTISPTLYGQNAWYVANPSIGYLDNYWDDIGASGVKYIRIGGIEVNFRPLYSFNRTSLAITNVTKLKRLIDSIRANGMEPIIQVGYNPECPNYDAILNPLGGLSQDEQATIAANLVD